MNLKNYELSDYEEYLLKRTGTENVSFTDGMVYATYHPQKNTTEIMKTNDDEFVALCIEAEEQMKPLQINSTDDNSEWLDCIRFPIDSQEIDEFERVFYEHHPDIKPQQKNNPLSGSIVTVPLGESLFEFVYADLDSLYNEVKFRLYKYEEIELPDADSNMQDNINRFISYRAYKELINCLAFGSTVSALFPPCINNSADISEAMDNKSQNRWAINYLNQGIKDEIEKGAIIILGKDDKGALVLKRVNEKEVEPKSVWNQTSHNASEYGTSLLNNIIGSNRFSYPKSLYAVKDTVLMCVADKKNALIVDFFAGSGTTLHAVNLLNAEDGGNRRCILVTNNEVSADEAEMLTSQGYHPGDEEWEKFGIARYVTWPRTICSIIGKDIKGNPITGDYGIIEEEFVLDDEDTIVSKKTGKPVKKNIYVKQKVQKNQKLESIKKADGFKANAAYFKLGFLDKNSVALGRRFKEMLPTLWMKAGANGRCPKLHNGEIQNVMLYPENKFAVLTEETAFSELLSALSKYSEIETVYIITDYEPGYRSMAKNLNVKQTYQLYRDYLDNFRINIARD